jgi:hypothetical protein
MKKTQALGEIFAQSLRLCLHCCLQPIAPPSLVARLRSWGGCHSILNASSATGGAFKISLSHRYAVLAFESRSANKKTTLLGGFCWRRRRDSNCDTLSRAHIFANYSSQNCTVFEKICRNCRSVVQNRKYEKGICKGRPVGNFYCFNFEKYSSILWALACFIRSVT